MKLLIALHQSNLDLLESELVAVSDPRSTSYGKHWSNDAIHALIAPKQNDVEAVMQWLSKHGVNRSEIETTTSADFLRASVTVAQAEALLHTKYFEFAHEARKQPVLRTLSYSVPTEIAHIIDIIGPTVRFPSVTKPQRASVTELVHKEKTTRSKKQHGHSHGNHHKSKSAPSHSGPDPSICLAGPATMSTTPACLRALYNVGTYKASPTSNSSVGVSAFQQQFFLQSDVDQFFQTYDPSNDRTVTIVGQNDPQDFGAGTESSLDIQYILAMAPGVPGTFWYDNTTDEIDFNLDFLFQLSAANEVPWVISDSYGVDEEAHTGPAMDRFNVEFQKAGLRGISMLFAMGDGGVGGGAYPALENCTVFIPAFPTSPYVTTVGGTDGYQPEAAWNGSSGGFSNYYPAPQYQTAQIANYFTTYHYQKSSA
jgi:tripeptidyl-peptidase-1